MRVTTKAYTNNYLKNNSKLVNNLLKSQSKILSQRQYNRASEDSVSAAKAAHVRKSLENLDIYDENCKTAKNIFYAAEDALYDMADKTYLNVKQKIVSIQDTKSQTELDIIAQELSELADHMVQDMNTDFAERQLFGAQSDDKTPFTVYSKVRLLDSDGNEVMLFGNEPDIAVQNGVVLNGVSPDPNAVYYDEKGNKINDFNQLRDGTANYSDEIIYSENDNKVYYSSPDKDDPNTIKFIVKGSCDLATKPQERIVCFNDVPIDLSGDELLSAVQGGRFEYYDTEGKLAKTKTIDIPLKPGQEGNADAFPGANPIYVDIGLGIKYDENGAVSPSTALNVCLNGAEITGYGKDNDGDSMNFIQLIYDAANAMRQGDRESVNRIIDKLDAAQTKILNTITDLGVKQNNMDYYVERNSIYRLNLLDKQNELEGCDLEEEITNWKTVEAAYNASLSMSSKVLPKSLFDFI